MRRLFFRQTRSTKYRVQLFIIIIVIFLLGLFFYTGREEHVVDNNSVKIITGFPQVKTLVDDKNLVPEPEVALPSSSSSDTTNCAYKNCPELHDDVVNVHVICHTHLDPGWINSIDGYFFGISHNRHGNNNGAPYRHSMPSVLTIFNNVIAALLENSQRRFVMVEMSFIWRWWKRLDDDYKQIIRKLMKDGRIDIAGGSWTSNDEAVSHYAAMIDQSTLGFRFLKSELRTCSQPAVAWQLDLFGHGREINSLFAQMGYDGILFGRLDYQEKQQRTAEKTLQMVWKVNENGPENERWLFTGILPNLYHPPETLAIKPDVVGSLLRTSDTDTIPESTTSYSTRLLAELEKQQERYNSNNIAVIYGGDFEYEDATQYFQNIDAMIDTINKLNSTQGKKKFHVHYSTPTCFLHALSKEKRSWPVREGDFMSYAHRAHAFWTGFYTSRPGIKFYERSLGALYQSMRQLSIIVNPIAFGHLFQLSEVMGLLQHHDTITGTSPVINIEDALQRMHQAEEIGENLASSLYQQILTPSTKAKWSTPLIFCSLNESYCPSLAQVNQFSAIVYNPSSISNQIWLRIPLTQQQTVTLDMNTVKKHSIDAEEIGTIHLSPILRVVPINYQRNQFYELVVRVNVPPLSLQAIPFIKSTTNPNVENYVSAKSGCAIENQNYILKVNDRGLISSIQIKSLQKEIEFQHGFYFYKSSSSDMRSHQQSGLYVFRPVGTDPPQSVDIKEFYCYKRKGYEEIIQVYSKFANQSIRLYDKSPYIEFDWIAGLLDANVELVTSYQTKNLNNSGIFYTDSSGRSFMKRKRDQRDGYTFTQSEASAGNYYPLVTGIIIKDVREDLQLSIVNDRAQGGGSIRDGQIEIMIHRRVNTDDGLGVSEVLNEGGLDGRGLVVRGRHLLAISKTDDGMQFFREHALKSVWKPVIAFRNDANNDILDYNNWSLLKSTLPPEVNLLTIEPMNQEKDILTILFRIEHIYDKNEHSKFSKPVSIPITKLFPHHQFVEAKEVTLGGNMYKTEVFNRLKWSLDSHNESSKAQEETQTFDGKIIDLFPMQIRSFIIKLSKN